MATTILHQKLLLIVAVALAVVVAITAASYVLRARSTGDEGAELHAADLAQLSMATTVAQMARAMGAEPRTETTVCGRVEGVAFDTVCFHWDEAHPDHVRSFDFNPDEPGATRDVFDPWLDVALGHRLVRRDDGSRVFQWAMAHVLVTAEGDGMVAGVSADDDPSWPFRLELLWRICLAASLDQDPAIDVTTRRQWLGQGYPLTTLVTVDLTATVEDAIQTIPATVPGAFRAPSNGITQAFEIAADHPWFTDAHLTWTVAPGGTLRSIQLQAGVQLPTAATFEHPDALHACLEDTLGPPDATPAGAPPTWTTPGLGEVILHTTHLDLTPTHPSNGAWAGLLRALDACGQEPVDTPA